MDRLVTLHLLSVFSHVSVFSPGQSRNWAYSQQQRLMSQRQRQEQQRQQEARRVERDRQLQAGLRDEESFVTRRHLRQVQEELKERQMESALLKVFSQFVLVIHDSVIISPDTQKPTGTVELK